MPTTNHELQLADALVALLKGLTYEYTSGGSEKLLSVKFGKVADGIGYPVAAVVPLGPDFPVEVLGTQGLDRVSKYVTLLVELHYEHHDSELGARNMSDLLWQTVDAVKAARNLGVSEMDVVLGETDYAFVINDAQHDENDNDLPDWGYKGVAVIPVIGSWRYRR